MIIFLNNGKLLKIFKFDKTCFKYKLKKQMNKLKCQMKNQKVNCINNKNNKYCI